MKPFCDAKITVSPVGGYDPEVYSVDVREEAIGEGGIITIEQKAGAVAIAVPVECIDALCFALRHIADFMHDRDFYLEEEKDA